MSPDEKQIRYRLKKNQRFNSVCNLCEHERQPYTYTHTHTSSAIQIHTISYDVDGSMYFQRNTITKTPHELTVSHVSPISIEMAKHSNVI